MSDVFEDPVKTISSAVIAATPLGLPGALAVGETGALDSPRPPARAANAAAKAEVDPIAEKNAKNAQLRKDYIDTKRKKPGRAGTVLSGAEAIGASVALPSDLVTPYPFVTG